MLSQIITIGGTTFNQSYTYDYINRLLTASEGSNWSQTYTYDRYGNRAETAGSSYEMIPSLVPVALTEYSTSNNRLASPSVYDSAGNLTSDKVARTMKYDAENRQTEFNAGLGIARYTYDGDGRRVQKDYQGETTVFAYDALGRLAAEYKNSAASGTGGTTYVTQDHLGSNRVTTDASGSVKVRHDYLPFGGEIASSVGGRSSITGYTATDTTRFRFTGKERDSESFSDFFQARYYFGAQGRFTSPDEFSGGPIGAFAASASANATLYADLGNPQSLNKYQYCLNNPLSMLDPDGHEPARAAGNENIKVQEKKKEGDAAIAAEKESKEKQQQQQGQSQQNPKQFSGDATYYNLPGSQTASGEKFDPNKMSAAMTAEKVDLGQTVTVTYTHTDKSGKTVTSTISVEVNDRGPFARDANGKAIHPLKPDPRGVIDLTPTAFEKLAGTLKTGRVPVTVKVPNE